MPPKDWSARIDHVLAAIADIQAFTAGVGEEEFMRDRKCHHAVLWCFQVIGEAIRWLPADFRDRYPEVEWRAIRAMRNLIVHQYEAIDLIEVWDVVQEGIPELRQQMQALKKDLDASAGDRSDG